MTPCTIEGEVIIVIFHNWFVAIVLKDVLEIVARELNNIAISVPVVLRNVDKFTSETLSGVAWRRCREEERIEFHVLSINFNFTVKLTL